MADVNYKIGADASEVVNELNKVHKSMRAFGRIKWPELAMGAQALVGHLSTLKNITSGVWDALIAPAAEVERFMTRFSTVLGSAESAGEHMRALRKYAADTPFELADIAAASGVLLGFGVQAAKSNAILRQLGDVAAVSGASLKDLAMIYGKVAAVGLETESVNQLAERQVNVRALLAARDGISVADVQRRLSAKQYGVADLDYVLAATTGKGGLHFEGTIKQARTLDGVLSTLKDSLTDIAAAIGEQFAPAIKAGIGKLAEHLPDIKRSLVGAVDPAKELFGAMADALPAIAKAITETVQGVSRLAAGLRDVVAAMPPWAMREIKALLDLTSGRMFWRSVAGGDTAAAPAAAVKQATATGAAAAMAQPVASAADIARGERAAELEQQLRKDSAAAATAAAAAAFGKLSAGQQAAELQTALRALGFTGRVHNEQAVSEFLAAAKGKAAAGGDEALFARLGTLSERFTTLQQRSAAATAMRRDIRTTMARDSIAEGGNPLALARFDATQSALAMAQQYMAAGMGQQEAARVAAQQAAAGMQLPQGGGHVATIAQSRVAIGGGGTSLRMGDAQLDVSRRHLNIAEETKRVLDNVLATLTQRSGSSSGIPVVP